MRVRERTIRPRRLSRTAVFGLLAHLEIDGSESARPLQETLRSFWLSEPREGSSKVEVRL